MTIARKSLSLIASAALASPALGQQSRGAGISGGSALGASVDYVREHWSPPDSVRLVAAVIWRGRSVWNLSTGEREAAASRALQDSASRTSQERHRLGGGTVTTRANAWVEYDESARTVYVWNQPFAAASGDSTLVLLVDNVDGVDGPPRIASIIVPHTAYGPKPDATATGAPDARDIGALHVLWIAVLRTNPEVRAFLEHTSRP